MNRIAAICWIWIFALMTTLGGACKNPDPPGFGLLFLGTRTILPTAPNPTLSGGTGETLSGLTRISATVTQVDVVHRTIANDPSTEKVITVESTPTSFDLAGSLQDTSGRMLTQLSIPVGFVFQVRLITSTLSIELRGETFSVKLPSGEHTGLKIEPNDGVPFEIKSGERTAGRILFPPFDQLIRNKGNGFMMKPVVTAEHVKLLELSRIALDRVVVGFKPNVSAQQIAAINSRLGTTVIKKWEPTNYYVLHLPTTTTLQDAVQYYDSKSEVDYALPDNLVVPRGDLLPCDPGFEKTGPFVAARFPAAWGDVAYTDKLGRQTVGKPAAATVAIIDTSFDLKNPDLLSNWFYNVTEANGFNSRLSGMGMGSGVIVPDFNGNSVLDYEDQDIYFAMQGGNWPNCALAPNCLSDVDGDGSITPLDLESPIYHDGVDTDTNGCQNDYTGCDFSGVPMGGLPLADVNYDSPTDTHGTAVAGIFGAVGRTTMCSVNALVAGTNWNARILPVKVGDAKQTLANFLIIFRSDIVLAINYAAATRASIANLSLGFVLAKNPLSQEGGLVQTDICRNEVIDNIGAKYEDSVTKLIKERKALKLDWPMGQGKMALVAAAPNCALPLPTQFDRFFDVWASRRDGSQPIVVVGVANYSNLNQLTCPIGLGAQGNDIDIAAPAFPAFNVLGITTPLEKTGVGSSAAAPLVTGTLTLMISKDPTLAGQAGKLKDSLLLHSPSLPQLFGCTRNGLALDAFAAVLNTP